MNIARTKVDLAESPGLVNKSVRNWFFDPGNREVMTSANLGTRVATWKWTVVLQ